MRDAIELEVERFDRSKLGYTKYPETQALPKVHSIGHITAPTYSLTLGSKQRFQ